MKVVYSVVFGFVGGSRFGIVKVSPCLENTYDAARA